MINYNLKPLVCKNCDALVERTSNRQLFCLDCRPYKSGHFNTVAHKVLSPSEKLFNCETCGKSTYMNHGGRNKRWCDNCRPNIKEYQRSWGLKNLYNLTPKQYNEILAAQNGGCAICGSTKRLAVDHSHDSKQVRGILCFRCNTNLAVLENTSWVFNAESYLAKQIYDPEMITG